MLIASVNLLLIIVKAVQQALITLEKIESGDGVSTRWGAPHRQWILAIHLPVSIVIFLRIFCGLGWKFITFPVLIGAFSFGQFVGGRLTYWLTSHT